METRMVRRRFLTALLLVPLVLGISGCPKDPYTAAMAGSKDVSDAVGEVLPVLQQVQQDKLITQAQENEVLGFLTKVTQGNQTFRATVKQVHASGQTGTAGYLNAADTFVKAVESQQIVGLPSKLTTVLKAVDTAIQGIAVAVANAKGVK